MSPGLAQISGREVIADLSRDEAVRLMHDNCQAILRAALTGERPTRVKPSRPRLGPYCLAAKSGGGGPATPASS